MSSPRPGWPITPLGSYLSKLLWDGLPEELKNPTIVSQIFIIQVTQGGSDPLGLTDGHVNTNGILFSVNGDRGPCALHGLILPFLHRTLHSVSDGMGVRLHHHGQGLFSSIKSRRVRVIDVLPAGEQIQEPLDNLPTLALHMILMLVQGMQPKL